MILLRQRYFSDAYYEQRLFRNKANREATRRWQMEQAGKNRIVITPEGQQQLQEAYNTPIGGKGAGKGGYTYGQASGPNGTRTLAERQSELLSEARSGKAVSSSNMTQNRGGMRAAGVNERNTFVNNGKGGVSNVALRDSENSLANKGNMTDRTRNLSEKRQRELAERRNQRAQAKQPTQQPKPVQPTQQPKPATQIKSTSQTASAASGKSNNLLSKNMQRIGRLYKGTSKYGRVGQVAAIGTTALGVGALGYGAYKAINKNKNKNQNISG